MTCPLLSSCDQSWLQAAISDTLSDAVTLRNPGTPTRGTAGGVVAGTVVDTSATGRLQQTGMSGDVQQVADRLQLVNPALWHFAYTQAGVTEKTQIIFGSRTFNVRAVDKEGAMGVELLAVCDEVR